MAQFDRDDSLFELVKTRLRVRNGEIQRLNTEGGYLMRLPLSEVESIEYRRQIDPVFYGLFGVGAALGIAAALVDTHVAITTVLYGGMGICLLLALFGFLVVGFQIRTLHGETRIPCDDTIDEGACFVISVRRLLANPSNSPSSAPSPSPAREPETGFRT